MKKLVLLVCLPFVLTCCASSATSSSSKPKSVVSGPFSYTLLDNDTYSIELVDKTLERIEIPSTFKDKTVSVIQNEGFKDSAAKEIVISDSIREIGAFSFAGCMNLKTLFIPKNVTKIGTDILNNTNFQVFVFCEVEKNNGGYVYDDGKFGDGYILGNWSRGARVVAYNVKSFHYFNDYLVALHNDDTYRLSGYFGEETNVQCPDTIDDKPVVFIGGRCFQNNTSLQSIELPANLTDIKSQAFYGCESLASVKAPSTLTHIYGSAFYGCKALESITYSDENSLKYVDDYAFRESGLISFTMHKDYLRIGACPFLDTAIEEITFIGSKSDLKNMLLNTTVFASGWAGAVSKTVDGKTVTDYQIKRVVCDDDIYDVKNGAFLNN